MTDQLIELFAEILNVPADTLNDDSSPNSVEQWDSLAAMHLVSTLEEEYDVELSTVEIMDMRSISSVRRILRMKGIENV